jgi:hypothetical protein
MATTVQDGQAFDVAILIAVGHLEYLLHSPPISSGLVPLVFQRFPLFEENLRSELID